MNHFRICDSPVSTDTLLASKQTPTHVFYSLRIHPALRVSSCRDTSYTLYQAIPSYFMMFYYDLHVPPVSAHYSLREQSDSTKCRRKTYLCGDVGDEEESITAVLFCLISCSTNFLRQNYFPHHCPTLAIVLLYVLSNFSTGNNSLPLCVCYMRACACVCLIVLGLFESLEEMGYDCR